MKIQRLIVFSLVTVAIAAIAGWLAKSYAPQTVIEKALLFPELESKVNDVAVITIEGQENSVTLLNEGERWVIQTADNYPAIFDKVKETVVGLAQLKILAKKTSNPELYAQLGVEGPAEGETESLLVTLKNNNKAELAALIIGRSKTNTGGNPNRYVRRPDQDQALLVEGHLQIEPDNNYWYVRDILDIPSDRIQTISITQADGSYLKLGKESKDATDFSVLKGKTTDAAVTLNKIATFFESVSIDSVKATSEFEFPAESNTAVFQTFDGLLITMKSAVVDDKAYAHFAFATNLEKPDKEPGPAPEESSTTEPDVSTTDITEEVQRLNESLSDWVYGIPEFKSEILAIDISNS